MKTNFEVVFQQLPLSQSGQQSGTIYANFMGSSFILILVYKLELAE